MKADKITDILKKYDSLPYRCILLDGGWGIGKSYAAKKANDSIRMISVSLSGITSTEDLYAEILDGLVSKRGFSKTVNKIAEIVGTITSQTGTDAANTTIRIADSLISRKSLVRLQLSRLKKIQVIILDDFERVYDGVDITEVFRVIDFLLSLKNVKTAIIGNISGLPTNIKEKFDRYQEKYIEKTYHISEISDNIIWESLGIDGCFIEEFRIRHPFENIRNVIKANDFYKDVKNELGQSNGT